MTMLARTMPRLRSRGHELESGEDRVGMLRDSSDVRADAVALRRRIGEDGYLLLRGILDREEVLDARRFIMEKLSERGELDPNCPIMDGVPKPGSELHFEPKLADRSNAPLQKVLY